MKKGKKKFCIHPLQNMLDEFEEIQPVKLDTDELKKLQALCLVFDVAYSNTCECRIIVARRMLRQMIEKTMFDENGVYASFADYVDKLLSDALKHCVKVEKVIV